MKARGYDYLLDLGGGSYYLGLFLFDLLGRLLDRLVHRWPYPMFPLGSTTGAFSGSSLSLDSDSATFSCRASSLSTPITMFDGDSSSKTPGCASSNWRGFQLLDLLGKSLLFTNLFWRVQGLQIHQLRHDLLFRNDL